MKTTRTHWILAGSVVLLILASGGSVQTAPQAKKSDPAALRPFQIQLCRENQITGCDDLGSNLTVPAVTSDGEPVLRLVIESVSGSCVLNTDGFVVRVVLQTVVNGTKVAHTFIPVRTAPGVFEALISHTTRIYADPGSLVEFRAGTVSASGDLCRITLSGFFAVE